MSDLVYQNYNNKCKGWVNPSNALFGPQINSLTGYQSPAGSNTVVSINGSNFYSYSTISFGTFNPTVYFINSNILQFYVPNTLSSGSFPVQVFNASVGSNIVIYTIDNASGYWLLNSNGTIINTNTFPLVAIKSLTRGRPITVTNTTTPYVLIDTDNWIICNGDIGVPPGDVIISLPTISAYNGREIMLKNISNTRAVLSASVNILSLDTNSPTNVILPAGYGWATLVFDSIQNKWIIMQGS